MADSAHSHLGHKAAALVDRASVQLMAMAVLFLVPSWIAFSRTNSSWPLPVAAFLVLGLLFWLCARQRQAIRDALQESETRFRSLIENAPDGVFVTGADRRYLSVNPAACAMTGYTEEEFARMRVEDLVPADGQAGAQAAHGRVVKGIRVSSELKLRRKDGSCFWVALDAVKIDGSRHLAFCKDIDGRKRIEEALRESEAKYRLLVETLQEGLWAIGRDSLTTYVNTRMAEILGYTMEEMQGRHLFSFMTESGVAASKAYLERRQQGIREKHEFEFLRKDGRRAFLLLDTSPILDAAGAYQGALAAVTDITDLKKAGDALGQSEQKFRTLFVALAEGVALHELVRDETGTACNYRVLDANPAFGLNTGLDPEHARGRLATDLYGTPVPPYLAEYSKVAMDGIPHTFETFFPPLEKHFRISIVSPRQGQFVTVFLDITERKQAEAALRSSEEKYSKTFNSAPLLVSLTDLADGRLVEVNDRYCEVLGYAREELIGNTTTSLGIITPADRLKLIELVTSATGTPKNIEFLIHTKSGRTLPILLSGNVIAVGGRSMLISMVLDITHLKRAEAEQLELHAQLQQSQRMQSLGTLVAGVAHNLNNVLAIAMGAVSIREDMAADPADRETYQIIGKVCNRGREVVKSLIHFAQPALVSQAPVELNAMVREVCALLETTTRNRIRIVEALLDTPLWINGNAGDLNHILVNLGVNSLDAMPDGGRLTFRTALLEGDWLELSVEDNGTGMTPEILAHVLEPFYTTKDVGKGTGLGLSMAYGVVKAHGGNIDIASQPGRGTTVKLRFPGLPAPAGRGPAPIAAAASSLASMAVFLVDDDEDVRYLMNRMLQKAGVRQVKVFQGGREVLESLSSEELPGLVILDQNMPGLTGTQTMERIRDLHPEMPILISSGQPDIEAWECFKRPRVGVISKPFNVEEIQAKLAQFADGPLA